MECISRTVNCLDCLGKVCECYYACQDSCDAARDENLTVFQKVCCIGTNLLFIGAQANESYGDLRESTVDSRLHARAYMTVADTARVIRKKVWKADPIDLGDVMDVASTAGARILSAVGFAGHRCPEKCHGYEELAKNSAEIAGKFLRGVNTYRDIRSRCKKRKTRKGKEEEPSSYPYLCALTGKPIQSLLVVKGTLHDPEPVFYEKSKIEAWISDSPDKRPPRWPEGLEVSRRRLVEFKFGQSQINRLRNLESKKTR